MHKLLLLLFSFFFLYVLSALGSSLPQQNPNQNVGANANFGSIINPFQSSIDRASAESSTANPPKRTIITILGIGKNEVLDYKSQEFEHFDINPISQDMHFKKGLSVVQYDILITGWLNSIYLNKFRNNVWALRYFSRALAEYSYSYNGFLSKDFYFKVIDRYKNYLTIDNELNKVSIATDIKYSLSKLYAVSCIYDEEVSSTSYAISKISKIPQDVILYHMEEQAGELYEEGDFSDTESQDKPNDAKQLEKRDLGNYVGYEHGENMYYICLAYYPKFKDLTKVNQVKFLDKIYSYNPTIILAPPLKRGTYAWNYLIDWIWPEKNPEVLKYCMKSYVNWVILPKNL